ncbi:MAG: hypothetical protein KAW88_07080 [Candidatus Cloacimonetes bacterium]|nr:hypothetical protein [Candidatus Cloacimonadota bacterium]
MPNQKWFFILHATARKGKIAFIIILLTSKVVLCQTLNNLKYEQYVNNKIGYEILYPSCWYAKTDSILKKGYPPNYERISFENIKEKVIVAGGGPFTEEGTSFQISTWDIAVKSDTLFTIEESIMSSHFSDNPEVQSRIINERLDQIQIMNFGNRKLKVRVGKGWADIGVDFIYKGKYFRFHFMSGSKEQYLKDYPVYEKMVNSFRLLQ